MVAALSKLSTPVVPQCATPKLPKKVLHIRKIVAHWVNFIILKTMFSPFSFIFVILELNFFLSVAHWGHEANHKLLKKALHIGDNVAH